MPNYYTVTHNPIARAGVIRKLMAKGYKLAGTQTVSDYFKTWPAEKWPLVTLHPFGGKEMVIDLHMSLEMYQQQMRAYEPLADCWPIKVSPVTLEGIPTLVGSQASQCTNLIEVSQNLVFAKPAKYTMEYQKADGTVGNYTIANPIEANDEEFKTYTFGRGVRTFKHARVRSFAKI